MGPDLSYPLIFIPFYSSLPLTLGWACNLLYPIECGRSDHMLLSSLILLEAWSLFVRSLPIPLERLCGEAKRRGRSHELLTQKTKNSINSEDQGPIHIISVKLVQLTSSHWGYPSWDARQESKAAIRDVSALADITQRWDEPFPLCPIQIPDPQNHEI